MNLQHLNSPSSSSQSPDKPHTSPPPPLNQLENLSNQLLSLRGPPQHPNTLRHNPLRRQRLRCIPPQLLIHAPHKRPLQHLRSFKVAWLAALGGGSRGRAHETN